MSQFYTKGTIKIKNADGVLEPFLPNTKTDCIKDYSSGDTLSEIIEEMEENIEVAANSGGVKVTYEEVTEQNSSQYSNESMVVEFTDYYVWRYKCGFSTERAGNVGIPFSLYNTDYQIMYNIQSTYNENIKIKGTLTSNDYPTLTNNLASKIYFSDYMSDVPVVTLISENFSDMYFQVFNAYIASLPDQATDANRAWVTYVSNLVEIYNPLPKFKGTQICGTNTKYDNSARYLFYWLHRGTNLIQSFPTNLFINNPQITDYSYCFYTPRSDDSIGNFDIKIYGENVTNAESFCRKDTSYNRIVRVPSGSTTETTFNSVASSLGLTIIGE